MKRDELAHAKSSPKVWLQNTISGVLVLAALLGWAFHRFGKGLSGKYLQDTDLKIGDTQLSIDDIRLTKWWSEALQGAQHHERLYTETWASALIIISIASALGYFVRKDITPNGLSTEIRWFMTIIGFVLGYFIIWSVARHGLEADTCHDIARQIEDIWAGRTGKGVAGTVNVDAFLIAHRITEIRKRVLFIRAVLPFIKKPGALIYFAIPFVIWVYIWWRLL